MRSTMCQVSAGVKHSAFRCSVLLAIFTCLAACLGYAQQPTYDETFGKARKLFQGGNLDEAYLAAYAAVTLDDKRWEAYGLLAMILDTKGAAEPARNALNKALERAPEDRKAALLELAKKLGTPPAPTPQPGASPAQLSADAQRQLDALVLLSEDADRATTPAERKQILNLLLEKSAVFAKEHPQHGPTWLLRAVAALELSNPIFGRQAAAKLRELGFDKSTDPKARKVMAALELQEWNQPVVPFDPAKMTRWTNSLGMIFVPVPGTKVWFCVWETRVRDFMVFATATGRGATEVVKEIWSKKYDGFDLTPKHPVWRVNWFDANEFCRWLSELENSDIAGSARYRLPTDAEWSAAAGDTKYPWGNDYPPATGAGNYGSKLSIDTFRYTSPVGSFNANQHGIYDLGGNVWEWCEDWYRKEMNTSRLLNNGCLSAARCFHEITI